MLRSRFRLADDDVPTTLVLLLFAAAAFLTPAQADTFYHLRAGSVMWSTAALLDREVFSHTTFGMEHPNHWWLAQLAFYGLHTLGGPLLMTVVSGGMAFLAVFSTWLLTRGSRPDVRLILLVTLAMTLPAWSVRPQVFSLLLAAATVRLVVSDRLAWLPPLMVLWANIHAVVVLGVILAFAPVVEAALWSRQRLTRTLLVAAGCALAPVVSPLGLSYWPYVFRVVREARALGIDEYRPAIHADAQTVAFWVVTAGLVFLAARSLSTLSMRDRSDRLLILSSAALAACAITSVRNASFFALAAIPALSRLMPSSGSLRFRPAPTGACVLIAAMGVGAAGFVSYRWRDEGAAVGWRPLSAEAISAVRACPEPMFNGFYAGGALIWFVPERRVFVDGRTDAYPLEFLQRVARAERQGEYRDLLADYGVQCAVVEADSTIARALGGDETMERRFSDAEWNVFRKRVEAP